MDGKLPLSTDTDPFWQGLLNITIGVTIPESDRVDHSMVVGAAGTGKTQLLQQLLLDDLKTDAAVVVMTMKGSLLPTISRLPFIQDRLVYFSPDNLIPLNLFGLGEGQAAVELINQMFSVVGEDSKATARQSPMLNHSIRLLSKVPHATIKTLRDLFRSPTLPSEYHDYLSLTEEGTADFMRDRFAEKALATVKESLMWRVDAVLDSPLIQRAFAQPRTDLNMSEIMEEGKVLLINTGGDHEDQTDEGSAFIGRFFIALVAMTAMRRKNPKRPVWFYIDEAGHYMTPNIGTIMQRCREKKVGLTIAFQELEDLKDNEAKVINNTATKFVGALRYQTDANKLASIMCAEPSRLQHQQRFNFHLTYPQLHARSLHIRVTPGLMEKLATHRPYQPSQPSNVIEYPKAAEPEKKYTPDPGTGRSME